MRCCSLLIVVVALIGQAVAATPASKPASAPAKPSALYERIASEFLEWKCDELEADLGKTADLATLSASEKADVAYIRSALAECRPAWWKQCKANQKVAFQPAIWGRMLQANFDPAAKGMQWKNEAGAVQITIGWNAGEMDDPKHAEHGFSKGELNNLGVWQNLGMAESWTAIPLDAQVNMTEPAKLLLQRYLEFRADVTGPYYGSPRARRWGLWLWMHSYQDKYQKMPTIMGRKAVAAMFIAEVVGHADKYPSIKFGKDLPADNAEEKLAGRIADWTEKHGWTVAEDKAIREALKTFAMANDKALFASGKVTLPNGMIVALDPQADAANRPKRDAWLKEQLASGGR